MIITINIYVKRVVKISDRKCNFKVFANLNYFAQGGVYFFRKFLITFLIWVMLHTVVYITYKQILIVNTPRLDCNTRSTRVQNII